MTQGLASDATPPPSAGHDAPLMCGSAALYFALALVPVAGLMVSGWRPGRVPRVPDVPWGDACVLLGGTVAAAAAARAVARSRSMVDALRAAATAHGAAAIATVAVCAVLLAIVPPRVFPRGPAPPPFLRAVYTRAVEPFFLPQLALGLGAAMAFRAATYRVRRRRTPSAPMVGPTPGGLFLALSAAGVCLAAFAAANADSWGQWYWFRADADHSRRMAVVTAAIPILMGVLAAGASAGALVRAGAGAALVLALASQLAAGVVARVLVAVAWIADRHGQAWDRGVDGVTALRGAIQANAYLWSWGALADSLVPSLIAAIALLVLRDLARTPSTVDDGRAPDPGPMRHARSAAGDVLLVCASVALFAFAALVVAVVTMSDRGPEHHQSALTSLPWAHLFVIAGGSFAAAASARRLAFARTARRALVPSLVAHALAAAATVAFCAALLSQVPAGASIGVTYRPRDRDFRRHAETFDAPVMETAGRLALTQLAMGLAAAVVFRRSTRSARASRSSWPAGVTAALDPGWPAERLLAALSAAVFASLSAAVVYAFLGGSVPAVPGHARENAFVLALAVPLLTGTLAAAASAGTIARGGLKRAAVVGAAVHLIAAVATPMVACGGLMALQLAAGHGAPGWMGLLRVPFVLLAYFGREIVAAIVVQTIVGTLASTVFWLGGSALARRQAIRATRS